MRTSIVRFWRRWTPAFLACLSSLLEIQISAQNTGGQEAQFLAATRQLTFEGRRNGEGYFSPDGQWLVFQSELEPDNPFYQIYLLDLATGDTSRLSPGHGKTTCAFFRPGTDEVLFASTHLDPDARRKQADELEFRASGQTRRYSWDYDSHYDIFSIRRDGTGVRRLTSTEGYDAEAAYSPDGRQIVFTSTRSAYPPDGLPDEDRKRLEIDPSYFADLFIMNADGTGTRQLTRQPGYDGGPFFSPHGGEIVWRRFNDKGTAAEIYRMQLGSGTELRVTDFQCISWAPFYHPSGKYLVFTANKLGFSNFELYLTRLEGMAEPVRVTFTDGFDGLPVFSPDGKRLCWTSNRSGDSRLFMADWNHAAALAALGMSEAPATPRAAEAGAPLSPGITEQDLRHHVSRLASDAMEGRFTGTPGAEAAASYIADQLRSAGVQPAERPAEQSRTEEYFQPFKFTAGVEIVPGANRLTLHSDAPLPEAVEIELDEGFRPLSFSANGEVEGEVVFAGYGLSVPGKAGEGYDSYAGLDVTNKIVLVLRYVPEEVSQERRQELNRYAGLRYKAMLAREHGAKAILIVTGPNSPNPGVLAPLSFDTALAGSGIVALSLSSDAAAKLLAPSTKTLAALQSALDTENPHAEAGFLLPKVRVRIASALLRVEQTDRNVVGVLPAPASGKYILLGAHYDHLGFGEGGSRENRNEQGQIHNGADDNASGVAAVLELAAALQDQRGISNSFPTGFLFAFWSGEELGLIGSSHFAEHPVVPLSNIVAYINFDMVGRLRDNKLNLQGAGSSPAWENIIQKRNITAGFSISLQQDPYLPTDATALYAKGVPVLNFFTGGHDDYHRPSDDADTLNYEGLFKITRFALGIVHEIARRPEPFPYAKVERPERGGSRDGLRIYLGTIPDYTAEVEGVKLSGVRGGSPADKAGMAGGDIIVEFAGQRIINIYDYTYAIDAAKVGQPTTVVILRNGERLNRSITPEAR